MNALAPKAGDCIAYPFCPFGNHREQGILVDGAAVPIVDEGEFSGRRPALGYTAPFLLQFQRSGRAAGAGKGQSDPLIGRIADIGDRFAAAGAVQPAAVIFKKPRIAVYAFNISCRHSKPVLP